MPASLIGPDIIDAVMPVVRALESMAVPYYLAGSVASSVHGVARSTLDSLDRAYMDEWAAELGIADLLARARKEAGHG